MIRIKKENKGYLTLNVHLWYIGMFVVGTNFTLCTMRCYIVLLLVSDGSMSL